MPAWVTGAALFYDNWDSGESKDNHRGDGEREQFVYIYNVSNPAKDGSRRFAWNDMYNDNTYSGEEDNFFTGTVGYICE